jgi:putative PIN family toxin of toxin-antitoxin system
MIRVVLDTNILISALLQPQGLPARTFLMIVGGLTAQLCVSGDIYAEYEEVIRRRRFNRSDNEIEQALSVIRERGLWVRPSEKVRACSDPDDDIFLECAQAARAHYLVTPKIVCESLKPDRPREEEYKALTAPWTDPSFWFLNAFLHACWGQTS